MPPCLCGERCDFFVFDELTTRPLRAGDQRSGDNFELLLMRVDQAMVPFVGFQLLERHLKTHGLGNLQDAVKTGIALLRKDPVDVLPLQARAFGNRGDPPLRLGNVPEGQLVGGPG